MPVFPSQDWLSEYVDLINASKEYEEAASSWEGDLSYVFEREPDKKVPDDVWVWIDLWHGKLSPRRARLKKAVWRLLKLLKPVGGVHLVPELTLAIRKAG